MKVAIASPNATPLAAPVTRPAETPAEGPRTMAVLTPASRPIRMPKAVPVISAVLTKDFIAPVRLWQENGETNISIFLSQLGQRSLRLWASDKSDKSDDFSL